jgi:hypothetical protein
MGNDFGKSTSVLWFDYYGQVKEERERGRESPLSSLEDKCSLFAGTSGVQ